MMDSLKGQLRGALKDAMRQKDRPRRDAIRLLNAAIKQVEIDTQSELDEAGVLKVLQKEAKKHRETIAELEAAGRAADADANRLELSILEEFLPRQLDRGDLLPIVKAAIAEVEAESSKDIGQVMRAVMPRLRGRADGKQVNAIVRELLG